MDIWFPKLLDDTDLATSPADVQSSKEDRLRSWRNAAAAAQRQGECIQPLKGVILTSCTSNRQDKFSEPFLKNK